MKPEKKQQSPFLTQDDIDTALRMADSPEAIIDTADMEAFVLDEADIIDPDSEDPDYFGLLSKQDIEALLHGDLAVSGGENAQDEVDSLLATAGSEINAKSSAAGGRLGKGNAAQDDVEQLIQKTVAGIQTNAETVATETPAAGPKIPKEGGVVSQDDIDRLLMSAIDESGEDAGHGPTAGSETPEEEGVVSQDDIDRLLMGAIDQVDLETETDFGRDSIETQGPPASRDDIGSLISQADLDQLMGEALSEGVGKKNPDQKDKTPAEHISQGDINRLLKESLEEKDWTAEEAEDEPDDFDETDATRPVILAVDEDSHESTIPIPDQPVAPMRWKTAWGGFKKKRLLASVAAGIVLALAVTMVVMLPGREETVLQPRVLTFSVPQPDGTVSNAQPVSAKSVHLAGFVILAPPNSADITYLTADLLLDLSDASFINIIKENEAFVRDTVYGTINGELMTRDISTIDENSLELVIRKELGRIIPRGAIERIEFERFSLV